MYVKQQTLTHLFLLPFRPFSVKMQDMKKAEIKAIGDYLKDVHEGICEWDGTAPMQRYLYELYRIIERLMDATFKTKDKQLKVLLATLEYKARKYKAEIEQRLAVRN